jgi:hypothetical protein
MMKKVAKIGVLAALFALTSASVVKQGVYKAKPEVLTQTGCDQCKNTIKVEGIGSEGLGASVFEANGVDALQASIQRSEQYADTLNKGSYREDDNFSLTAGELGAGIAKRKDVLVLSGSLTYKSDRDIGGSGNSWEHAVGCKEERTTTINEMDAPLGAAPMPYVCLTAK